jgi:Peptidase inhibitor family I36
MNLSRAITVPAATAVLAAAGTLVATAPANAGTTVQDQVNTQLSAYSGGVQTAPNEVSYKGGKVTVAFQDLTPAADTCATDAYCFYDGKDFAGRKLTFRDCGGWQYLTDYGFGNKTSSWSNPSKNTVKVYDEDVSPRGELWTENPGAASSNVGSGPYNKADSFLTYCP